MHTFLILMTAAAFISGNLAAFNPFTVTGLTPEQSAAVNQAQASLLSSITAQPEFASIIQEIVTDTQAFNALTQLLGQPLPTGTQGEAELNSIFNQLPPDAQSFFRSLTAEEALIMSSIIYSGSSASGSSATETVPASAGATTTAAMTAQSSQPSLTQASTTPSTTSVKTTQTNFTGSTLTTLTSSPPTTNSSSSQPSIAVITKNAGVLLRSGGVGLVLAILGAGIAAL